MNEIEGGYKTLRVFEIAKIFNALQNKRVSLSAARVFFSTMALVACYEAHKRSKTGSFKRSRGEGCFSISKLCELASLTEKDVRRELRLLSKQNLISIERGKLSLTDTVIESHTLDDLAGGRSIKRPVPIPRSMLRFLSRVQTKSLMLTTLCYLVRGLTITMTGEIKKVGSVKASWIASVAGMSLRSVRLARAKLIKLEMISKDESSTQWKLNRTGAYFSVITTLKAVENPESPRVISAPPIAKIVPIFAPPIENKKTPYGSKYQKTEAGVFSKREVENRVLLMRPTIQNVQKEDLEQFSRSDELYHQACEAGLIKNSEASYLNWFGAAVRAKSAKKGDAAKIFMGIVRKNLWMNITQEQEDRARAGINRYRNR